MPRPADPNAKDALVAAARKEFARRGVRGARIEDITAACGLSKGAFYLHYKSKEALFGELVHAFLHEMSCAGQRRQDDMAAFLAENGPISRRDVEDRNDRYRKLLELDTAEDLRVLEHMWSFRDVVGVLLRGSQGTRFEGAIWEITDGEIDRVQETFQRFQGDHACRDDIPSEVFGAMIVGTYVLLAMRMSRMKEKPDLHAWARSLHTLVREGSAPIESPKPKKSVRSGT